MTKKETSVATTALSSAEEAVGGLWHDVTTVPPGRAYHQAYNQAVYDATNEIKKLIAKYTENYNNQPEPEHATDK